MALSKKQVKQLRAMANQLNPLLYIGKNDLTDAAVKQASETMDSHELLKVAVQDPDTVIASGPQPYFQRRVQVTSSMTVS